MLKEGVNFHEAITIAQGVFDSRGEVLPQRTPRSGRLSRRTRYNYGSGEEGSLGRRARALNGP